MDYYMPRPQTDNDQKMDINEIAFSKLHISQNDPKEELVEVTDLLILPPMTRMPEDMVEKWRGNKKKKKSTKHIREHTWDSSVKRRRAMQSQNAQATVTLPEDKNIHELQKF